MFLASQSFDSVSGEKGVRTFWWLPVMCLAVALLPSKVASVGKQMCGQLALQLGRCFTSLFVGKVDLLGYSCDCFFTNVTEQLYCLLTFSESVTEKEVTVWKLVWTDTLYR